MNHIFEQLNTWGAKEIVTADCSLSLNKVIWLTEKVEEMKALRYVNEHFREAFSSNHILGWVDLTVPRTVEYTRGEEDLRAEIYDWDDVHIFLWDCQTQRVSWEVLKWLAMSLGVDLSRFCLFDKFSEYINEIEDIARSIPSFLCKDYIEFQLMQIDHDRSDELVDLLSTIFHLTYGARGADLTKREYINRAMRSGFATLSIEGME